METSANYIFHKQKLISNYNSIKNSFSKYFDNYSIAYSFKTNSYTEILKTLLSAGAYAEVVSPEEYYLAKEIGFEISKIIYNGPCKTENTILECSLNGGKVNIDNEEDLNIAVKYFNEHQIPLSVGVRLNFDIGNGIKSHFGIKTNSELFDKIIELNKTGIIKVFGLHCHFTNSTDTKFWINKIRTLVCNTKYFDHLEYLDFGGNMMPVDKTNLLIEYAKLINNEITQNMNLIKKQPQIIIEPGTPLVSTCFDLKSHVLHIKDDFIVLDCCIFDLGLNARSDTIRLQAYPKNPLKQKSNQNQSSKTLVGYTCLENDILKKSFSGNLSVGDIIIFKDCGAYSINWSNNFIKPVLPIINSN